MVPRPFVDLARIAACHRDAERWQTLYRVLWRLQQERWLLSHELDEDVAALRRLEQQVRRDLHKMHAFLRFRKCAQPDSEAEAMSSEAEGCFIAWYQPDHRILRLAVPFFAERFAVMRWAILTPDESAAWDPVTKQAVFGPGAPREAAPAEDELETMWQSYYASIFNPARLNTQAMRAEMPVRYWRELPELAVLPALVRGAGQRVETMLAAQRRTSSAAAFLPEDRSLPELARCLPGCRGCELYKHATQPVFGAGGTGTRLMLVGEQPGDEEDRGGAPFVGPAGKVLDRALEEIGIERSDLYVTNAVKHFKFVPRGKRRIHQSPRLSEIMACRPWLLAEMEAVVPRVVVCLGASAARSLLSPKFALMRERGRLVSSPVVERAVATLHPSAVLRAATPETGEGLYETLRADLALAWRLGGER